MGKNLNKVIKYAVVDEDFRKLFLSNPKVAAEKFNLSNEEVAHLSQIDTIELAEVNSELEERLSKTFINLPIMEDNSRSHTSHGNGNTNHQIHSSLSHSSW